MKKPNINWFQKIAEWVFLFVIFLFIWTGLSVETPFSKALSFTGAIVMTIGLINIMKKEK